MIRVAEEKDLVGIAAVHQAALPETLISRMGRAVIERLYRTLLHQDNAKIYLRGEGKQVDAVASWAMSYQIALDPKTKQDIVKKIWRDPRKWLGVMERALMGQYIKLFFGYEPWLLTLAVAKNIQGKGVGSKLVERVWSDVKLHGQSSLLVETLRTKEKAVHFYEKRGFKQVKRVGPNIILRKTL